MIFALLAFVLLVGCSDNDMNPIVEDIISPCENVNNSLSGEWKRSTIRQDFEYDVYLTIVNDSDCVFSYTTNTYILNPPTGFSPLKIYTREGDIFVDQTHEVLSILNFYYESRVNFTWNKDQDGNVNQDTSVRIDEPKVGKIWDDQLVLWGSQYKRI